MTDIQRTTLDNGIVVLTLDRANSKTNLIDDAFTQEFDTVVAELKAQQDLRGVIVESAKSTFVAGGDLALLSTVTDDNANQVIALLDRFRHSLRELETLGKPVVACLNGSALGGGLELALACHHRIAVTNPKTKVGLPEVTLGLLPAAGGVSRITRMLGLEQAIPFLTEGRLHSLSSAQRLGIISQMVTSADEARAEAIAWIDTHPESVAPWDANGFRMPGGLPQSSKTAQLLSIAPAMILKKTQGCYPAANAILSCAVEGATLSMDAAGRLETRYFLPLAKGAVSKNLINTLFFAKNKLEATCRTDNAQTVTTVGVVGAGMMGAGIAWACAVKGLTVVLVDTDLAKAEKGKAYSESLVHKRLERKQLTAEQGQALLNRIQPSDSFEALRPCELVIEAVFEDRALKADVFRQIQANTSDHALLASNTSTLPISSLAESVNQPETFIGLHFFSPVDKMPLLEIIKGEATNEATVQRALAFAGQIAKTPIVVNDGRGFFTSRVFKTFTYEGMAMLAEGIPAAAIENAAWLAGYPVGPLAVSDEVTLTLMERIRRQTQADMAAENQPFVCHPGDAVIDRMLELNRVGKSSGGGFYQYPSGAKKQLWSGLAEHFGGQASFDLQTLKDRFLYIQSIEAFRALNDGIVTSKDEANVGSILGFGYPAWTGGAIQFAHQTGLANFVARAHELEQQCGERFNVSSMLIE